MGFVSLATAVASVDVASADRDGTLAFLRDVSRLLRLVQAADLRGAVRLAELADEDPSFNPEHANAEATQRSLKQATNAVQRAIRSTVAPVVADAVGDGSISVGHLDEFLEALQSLDEHLRPRLLEQQHELVRLATTSTVEDFRRKIRATVRTIEGDDGKSRLEKQQRETGVRTWTGRDGMWNLHGRFDPATALPLLEALRRETEALFHGDQPEGAPSDPVLRHHWYQAHALAKLIQGQGSGAGAPEVIVTIDHETLTRRERHAGSRVDCGCELEIPIDTLLAMLTGRAGYIPVVLSADGTVIAQGPKVQSPDELIDALRNPVDLDHGRRARHADKRLRHALRAMYRTCAIPGCRVPFNNCEIHHIIHWKRGGPTTLDNCLPICAHHHDRLHRDHWTLHLSADRSLTIRKHGVVIMTTGPPAEQWAA